MRTYFYAGNRPFSFRDRFVISSSMGPVADAPSSAEASGMDWHLFVLNLLWHMPITFSMRGSTVLSFWTGTSVCIAVGFLMAKLVKMPVLRLRERLVPANPLSGLRACCCAPRTHSRKCDNKSLKIWHAPTHATEEPQGTADPAGITVAAGKQAKNPLPPSLRQHGATPESVGGLRAMIAFAPV